MCTFTVLLKVQFDADTLNAGLVLVTEDLDTVVLVRSLSKGCFHGCRCFTRQLCFSLNKINFRTSESCKNWVESLQEVVVILRNKVDQFSVTIHGPEHSYRRWRQLSVFLSTNILTGGMWLFLLVLTFISAPRNDPKNAKTCWLATCKYDQAQSSWRMLTHIKRRGAAEHEA